MEFVKAVLFYDVSILFMVDILGDVDIYYYLCVMYENIVNKKVTLCCQRTLIS